MITITLNGKTRETESLTLGALLEELSLRIEWTLVELNGTALSKTDVADTSIKSNDVIEIVRAVAGG